MTDIDHGKAMTRHMLEYHARNAHTEEQRQAARDELLRNGYGTVTPQMMRELDRFTPSPDKIARRVQDFDSLPQYIAARQAERDAMITRHARWLRTWGRAALLALALLFAALLVSHAAPKAIALLADPLAGMPY